MAKKAVKMSADDVVATLNMLIEADPMAIYRLANLRVACHGLRYTRPDLTCHVSELEFPVMGALELINILLTENTDKAIYLKIDKRKQTCSFEVMDKSELKTGGAVFEVPEVI